MTEGRLSKLDLASMSSLVTADHSAWSSSKLRFVRIDGPSTGDVQFDHLVGVFATKYEHTVSTLTNVTITNHTTVLHFSDVGVDYRLKITGDDALSTDTTTSKYVTAGRIAIW